MDGDETGALMRPSYVCPPGQDLLPASGRIVPTEPVPCRSGMHLRLVSRASARDPQRMHPGRPGAVLIIGGPMAIAQ